MLGEKGDVGELEAKSSFPVLAGVLEVTRGSRSLRRERGDRGAVARVAPSLAVQRPLALSPVAIGWQRGFGKRGPVWVRGELSEGGCCC